MRTVAIIEDEPDLLYVYGKLLKLKGYNVVFTLSSGDEVLDKLRDAPVKPDILIVGSNLNEETVRKIKADYPNIEIKMTESDEWHDPVYKQPLFKFLKKRK